MAINIRIPEHQELKPRILVFGIGGAGGNAVNNMMLKNLEGAEFIAANTDAQALQQSNAQTKLQLGLKRTQGLGAGAKPEVGNDAAHRDDHADMRIIAPARSRPARRNPRFNLAKERLRQPRLVTLPQTAAPSPIARCARLTGHLKLLRPAPVIEKQKVKVADVRPWTSHQGSS